MRRACADRRATTLRRVLVSTRASKSRAAESDDGVRARSSRTGLKGSRSCRCGGERGRACEAIGRRRSHEESAGQPDRAAKSSALVAPSHRPTSEE